MFSATTGLGQRARRHRTPILSAGIASTVDGGHTWYDCDSLRSDSLSAEWRSPSPSTPGRPPRHGPGSPAMEAAVPPRCGIPPMAAPTGHLARCPLVRCGSSTSSTACMAGLWLLQTERAAGVYPILMSGAPPTVAPPGRQVAPYAVFGSTAGHLLCQHHHWVCQWVSSRWWVSLEVLIGLCVTQDGGSTWSAALLAHSILATVQWRTT